jgi:F420-non-reducing hydrogenase iron-sulfur subunit
MASPVGHGFATAPRILVLSTNSVSDPGVDLAGSAHMEYSVTVRVIALPCSSGINPRWILHALDRGFDGVFIAADGGDCSRVPNCTERTGKLVSQAQELMRGKGYATARVRTAALCSVCSEPFVSHMRKFAKELSELPPTAVPAG